MDSSDSSCETEQQLIDWLGFILNKPVSIDELNNVAFYENTVNEVYNKAGIDGKHVQLITDDKISNTDKLENLFWEVYESDNSNETIDKTTDLSKCIKLWCKRFKRRSFNDEINGFIEFFGYNDLYKYESWNLINYDIIKKILIECYLIIVCKIIFQVNEINEKFNKINLLIDDNCQKVNEFNKLNELNDFNIEENLNFLNFNSNFQKLDLIKINEILIDLEFSIISNNEIIKFYKIENSNKFHDKLINLKLKVNNLINLNNKLIKISINSINSEIDNYQLLLNLNFKALNKAITLIKNDLLNKLSNIQLSDLNYFLNDLNNLKSLQLRNDSILQNIENIENKLIDKCVFFQSDQIAVTSDESKDQSQYRTEADEEEEEEEDLSIIQFDKLKYFKMKKYQNKTIDYLIELINNKINQINNENQEKFDICNLINIINTTVPLNSNIDSKNDKDLHLKIHLKIRKIFKDKLNEDKINSIRIIFNKFDDSNKGYLTKSEFLKCFKFIYKNCTNDEDINEIFEMSYETIGKIRRGIEFNEFETIIKLGNKEEFGHLEDKINDIEITKIEENEGGSVKDNKIDIKQDYFTNAIKSLFDKDTDKLDNKMIEGINLNWTLRKNLKIIFKDNKYSKIEQQLCDDYENRPTLGVVDVGRIVNELEKSRVSDMIS